MGKNKIPQNPNIFAVTKLLGSIVCTPNAAMVGESVRVEVRGPNGVPYDHKETVPITINGIPGSTQYLTWDFAGTQSIIVIAHRRNAVEKLTTTIEIAKRPDEKRAPQLQIRWQPENPTVAQFTVLNHPLFRRRGKPSRLPAGQSLPFVMLRKTPVARKILTPPPKLQKVQPKAPGVGGFSGSGTQSVTYEWDFGDGIKLGTILPTFAHDYGPRLDGQHLNQVFHVTVKIHQQGENPIVLRRSISVHNPYVLMKRRGILQPPIAETDLSSVFTAAAFFSPAGYRAKMTLRNPEPFDLTLTQRRIERIYGDDKRFSEMLNEEPVNVVLKANSSTVVNIFVQKDRLPKNIIGFAAHYIGRGPNNIPIRITGHFDLPQHLPREFKLAPQLLQELDRLSSRGVLSNPKLVPRKELKKLEAHGLISTAVVSALFSGPQMIPMSHTEPPMAIEGEECDPWNLPDVVPDNMFCMPTQEKKKVLMPPRFMNAKKGDIILSPGDGGLISDVLRAVTPPQPFSHSGIMTRNRDEITHSTASEKRIMSEDFVDGDGIRPDVLKYLWPGVITQTIDQAVHGQDMVDPEIGSTYKVAGFASQLGEIGSPEITVPMVVKPDPLIETIEIRNKLRDIANFAADQAGKSHYRFFCYTNPSIGLTDIAPSDAKWAAGTFPTVCSSLIWMAIKQAGVEMESALEPSDISGGAQIALGTPDGLYLYSAAERLNAGEVLFSNLHSMVMKEVGSWGDAVTDAADDISNQILNTFATDWADEDAKDSEDWKNTSDANAVSPQNLMFYDIPTYGFAEPLIFRDFRVEEVVVHKWKKVEQTGTIKGVVRFKGNPVKGANVQLSVSQFTASQADGSFEITGAPAGEVLIEAQKVQDDMLLMAQVKVDVNADETTNVNIDLQAPSHLFRRVRIEGWMDTIDYEFAAAAYPHCMGVDIEGIADLDPGTATHVVNTFDNPCDDAVGRLIVICDLLNNDVVRVKVKLRCYNSDEASGDDYSKASIDAFELKPDESWSGWIYTDDDNYAEAHFTVTNRTNQS